MGGEDLKNPLFALLLLGAGLFIQIPAISAQDAPLDGQAAERESPSVADTLRASEEIYTFGDDDEVAGQAASSSIWVVIRMIMALALVAAAIYGVVYFIKKSSKPAAASDPFLKILATAHLGTNRYAHIVSVGSKAWLLGSSDGGVNLIGEVEDKDVIDAMLLEDSRKSTDASTGRFPDFMAMLRRLGAPAGTPADTGASNVDEIRKRRERLRGL